MTKKVSLILITLALTACGINPGLPDTSSPVVPTQTPWVITATPNQKTVSEDPTATQQAPTTQKAKKCPQARDLGPWAPTASGEGLTFEVTASDQSAPNFSSAGVVLGVWWPGGTKDYSNKEVTTFVPRGLSVAVIAGAGRGWDYERSCSDEEVKIQMDQHIHDRPNDTSYYGFVPIETLIEKGLVEVRFDRRSKTTAQITATPAPTSTATPIGKPTSPTVRNTIVPTVGGVCKANRVGDSDNLTSITAPANTTYVVEAWGGTLGDAFVVVPIGKSITRNWQGGALWSYPSCFNTTAVLADVSNRGKIVYLVVDGKLVKQ